MDMIRHIDYFLGMSGFILNKLRDLMPCIFSIYSWPYSHSIPWGAWTEEEEKVESLGALEVDVWLEDNMFCKGDFP